MSRQAFVQKEIWKHKSVRIFSCSYAGKKIWVKQAEPVRNVSWLRFARRACLFFGLGILQPSADPDGRRALRFETGRLRRLSARGIRVPEVFAAGDEWLALADCGDNLIDVLGGADVPVQAAQTILSSAAENLAALHALGIHHGRPALKDMVWDGQEFTLLDFEDGIIVGLSREKRILRDLLIFMQSILRRWGMMVRCWQRGHLLSMRVYSRTMQYVRALILGGLTSSFWFCGLACAIQGAIWRVSIRRCASFGNRVLSE